MIPGKLPGKRYLLFGKTSDNAQIRWKNEEQG
jgi:hypothetical protein